LAVALDLIFICLFTHISSLIFRMMLDGRPENQVLDVIELLLTAHIYNDMDDSMKMIYPPISEKTYGTPKSEEWTDLSLCRNRR